MAESEHEGKKHVTFKLLPLYVKRYSYTDDKQHSGSLKNLHLHSGHLSDAFDQSDLQ